MEDKIEKDRIKAALKGFDSYDRRLIRRQIKNWFPNGGIDYVERAVQFVKEVPTGVYYSAPAVSRFGVGPSGLENLEHCETLAKEIGKELRPFDELQERGDLSDIIGIFVEYYGITSDKKGKEFVERKVRNFESRVKNEKWLCIACGIDFFSKLRSQENFLDHSAWGKDGKRYYFEYLDGQSEPELYK